MFECEARPPAFSQQLNFSCDFYSNDSDASPKLPDDTFSNVIEVYIIGILCVLGIVGNSLSVAVFRYDRLAREPLFLLSVLAVVDGLYLFTCLLKYPLLAALSSWEYVEEYKIIINPLTFTMQTMAIWTMLPVTFDRYLAACHPFSGRTWCTRRNKLISMAVVVLLSVLYNIPRWLESCIVTHKDMCTNQTVKFKIINYQYAQDLYFDLYSSGAYLVFVYIIPLVTLIILNIKLIQAIMYSAKRHRCITGRDEQTEENNTTRVLVIVVIEFIICQTPELVRQLIAVLNRHLQVFDGYHTELNNLRTISILLLVVNSAINFLIYFLFGRKFRRQLGEIFMKNRLVNKSTVLTTHIEQDVGIPLNSKPSSI